MHAVRPPRARRRARRRWSPRAASARAAARAAASASRAIRSIIRREASQPSRMPGAPPTTRPRWTAGSTSPPRDARRADPPGPDRQRPGERVDARLQGRPHRAARVRRAAARQPRERRGRSARSRPRSQVDDIETDFSPKPQPRDRRAARLRHHRRGLLRRAHRAGHALHAQRPVHASARRARWSPPQGDPVLGRGGQTVRVGDDGRVDPRSARGRAARQPAQGRRQPRHRHAAGNAGTGQVRAGALEGSGADPARSMVDMIASLRAFEAGQQVIHDDRRDARQGGQRRSAPSRLGIGRQSKPRRSSHCAAADNSGRMLEGLNSAAAGMAAQQQRLDAVANDLANVNTTGYKHVRVGFRDLVYRRPGRRRPGPAHRRRRRRRRRRPLLRSRARCSDRAAARRRHPGRRLHPRQAPRRPPGADPRRLAARRRHRPPRRPPPARSSSRRSPSPPAPTRAEVVDRPPTAPSAPAAAASAASSSSRSARRRRCSRSATTPSSPPRSPARRRAPRRPRHARAGRARGLERRHLRGDGRDDRVPARVPARVQGDPDAGPDAGDRQRGQALMDSLLPAISDATLPAEVRTGTAADKQAYKAALGFEQVLLGQLVKEMTAGRRRSTDGPCGDAVTDALTAGAHAARRHRPRASSSTRRAAEDGAVMQPDARGGAARPSRRTRSPPRAAPARGSCSPRARRSARRDVERRARPLAEIQTRDGPPRPARAGAHAPAAQRRRAARPSPRTQVTLERLCALISPRRRRARRASAPPSCAACSAEIAREHGINRALMRQELAFLSHLERLVGNEPEAGYRPAGAAADAGARRRPAPPRPWTCRPEPCRSPPSSASRRRCAACSPSSGRSTPPATTSPTPRRQGYSRQEAVLAASPALEIADGARPGRRRRAHRRRRRRPGLPPHPRRFLDLQYRARRPASASEAGRARGRSTAPSWRSPSRRQRHQRAADELLGRLGRPRQRPRETRPPARR